MIQFLEDLLRSDSPRSMTRANMAIGGGGVIVVLAGHFMVQVAVAYRVRYGLTVPDLSWESIGVASIIGALGVFAWGQARERSKTPPAGGPPVRPTTTLERQDGT